MTGAVAWSDVRLCKECINHWDAPELDATSKTANDMRARWDVYS